jgi:hypothetical protein
MLLMREAILVVTMVPGESFAALAAWCRDQHTAVKNREWARL